MYNDNSELGIIAVLMAVVIIAIVFLLLRGLVLWYWKINILEKKLTEVNDNLQKLIASVNNQTQVIEKKQIN